MYAVVSTGGKQYRVAEGDVIEIEKLDAKVGDKVTLDVLFIADGDKITIGKDLSTAQVTGEVVEHFRGEKVIIFKFKKRKGYKRTKGHRQELTRVKVTGVASEGGKKATAKPKAEPKAEPKTAAKAAPKPAAKAAPKPAAKAAPKPAAKTTAKPKATPKPKAEAAPAAADAPGEEKPKRTRTAKPKAAAAEATAETKTEAPKKAAPRTKKVADEQTDAPA